MPVRSFILPFLLLSIIQTTLSDVIVYNNSNQTIEDLDTREGSFYPSLSSEGVEGYVMTTNPYNGCSRISPPPNIPTFGYHWIALIARTQENDHSCDFTIKIENAYKANFSAVIVYNYKDELLSMGPDGTNVNIPATFITHTSGSLLINKYLYNITSANSTPIYHIKITPDRPFNIGAYLIPFAAIISIVLLGFIGFMLIKCHLQRRRTLRHRLPRSALKQLKIKKFTKGDPWEVCAICLDDYEDGAKLRILPCEHAYHMKCIDPWLLNNRRQCPVCKRYVFPDENNSDEEENHDHQRTRTPTEQTPLVNANNDNSVIEISRNRQLPERQLVNPLNSGVSNDLFTSNDSSDDDKDLFLPSRLATTTGLVFDRSSSNARRYGSTNDSSTTRHAANFFVDSFDGATDNTNTSARSVLEDVSDIETTDDDERMHSVANGSEENPAYLNDEQSVHKISTHL